METNKSHWPLEVDMISIEDELKTDRLSFPNKSVNLKNISRDCFYFDS